MCNIVKELLCIINKLANLPWSEISARVNFDYRVINCKMTNDLVAELTYF